MRAVGLWRVLFVLVMVAGVLLQISLVPALRPLGVVPNIVLVMIILAGLEGPASLVLITAVAGGLMLDLASGANFGLWTGVLVLSALSGGLLRRAGIELIGGTVAAVMVLAGTVLMSVIIWAGLLPTVSYWPLGSLLGHLVLEAVLNLVVMIALRPLMHRVTPQVSADDAVAG